MAQVRYTGHAIERLFERRISPEDCEHVIKHGRVIESDRDAEPFPTDLFMGRAGGRVLHVVVSYQEAVAHVVTAYEPARTAWNRDLSRRRKRS